MTRADTAALRRLRAAGTEGEWKEDDGNIFSVELNNKRHETIIRRLNGEDIQHPDEGRNQPLGYLGKFPQDTDNFEANALLAVAAVNALEPLCDEVDELRASHRQSEGFGACCALTALHGAITGEWDGVSGAEEAIRDDGFHGDAAVSALLSDTIAYVAALRATLDRVRRLVGRWLLTGAWVAIA